MYRSNLNTEDLIFGLASGSLPSAVAIYKISGRGSFDVTGKLFVPEAGGSFEKKRGLSFGKLRDESGKFFDSVLVIGFVGPASHTGEDLVEIHCHGSRAISRKLEECLLVSGLRKAIPGEFSYRAFLNGKISAAELDLLGDVFSADSIADLDAIYARRDGHFAERIHRIRDKEITLQAILDTAIDFSDEYSNVVESAKVPLDEVIHDCSEIIQRYSSFKSNSGAQKIVIVGAPNAGKSSLFNALLRRYRSIVHDSPGTTRDVVEEDIDLNGKRMKLVDTAGLRQPSTEMERIGIELGENYLQGASAWILVVDGTVGIQERERELLKKHGSKPFLVVWSKADLQQETIPSEMDAVSVSSLSGLGLDSLIAKMAARFTKDVDLPIPSDQEAGQLRAVLSLLDEMKLVLSTSASPELLAEINQSVLRRLENMMGEVETEQVLDKVFSSFCIGK